MSKQKRILISIHYGDSIAHVLRIRDLIKELVQRNFEVVVSVPQKAKNYLKGYIDKENVYFSGQNYSYAMIPYSQDFGSNFSEHAKSEYRLYCQYEPDIIIGDTGFVTHSYKPNIPFLKILNRFYVEIGSDIDSPFSSDQKKIIKKQTEKIVNNARKQLGFPNNFQYEEFIKPKVFINGASYFVNDISEKYDFIGINMALNSCVKENRDPRKCFVVLGTGFSSRRTKEVSKLLHHLEKHFSQIFISYGMNVKKNEFYIPENTCAKRFFKKVPNDIGLIISHGGLGTIHLGIQMQVPIIALPMQIEQYSNAYRLEKLGWGINIGKLSSVEFGGLKQEIQIDWDLLDKALQNKDSIVKSVYIQDKFRDYEHNFIRKTLLFLNNASEFGQKYF